MNTHNLKHLGGLFLILITATLQSTIYGQDCSKLPSTFTSYEQATSLVKNSVFRLKETVDTSKSSWIRGATFYSCDGQKGFLIIRTDDRDYIHQNVPLSIWRGFKQADSFGSYYNSRIKGNYRINIS